VLVAGLKPVDPAFESWWVRPGSATVVELHGDDRITVIDPEGGQPAEVTVLAPDGREDPGALGVSADAPASVLRDAGDDGFLAALHARGLRPHDAKALRLFGHDSPPGAAQAFRAEREAVAIVAAPGGRIVDGDRPAPALRVEIRPSAPRPAADGGRPPPGCRRGWPSRGWTSASTSPARWPTRSARASTSRSSTSRAGSARTSSPSTAASW